MRGALGGLALATCIAVCADAADAAPPSVRSPHIRAQHAAVAASTVRFLPPARRAKALIVGEAVVVPSPVSPLKLVWISYSTVTGSRCLDAVETGGPHPTSTLLSCNEPLPCANDFCVDLFPRTASSPTFIAGSAPARADTLRLGFAQSATASVPLRGPIARGVGTRMYLVVTGKTMPTSITLLAHGRVLLRLPLGK